MSKRCCNNTLNFVANYNKYLDSTWTRREKLRQSISELTVW